MPHIAYLIFHDDLQDSINMQLTKVQLQLFNASFISTLCTWKTVSNIGHISNIANTNIVELWFAFHLHTRCISSQHVPFTNFTLEMCEIFSYILHSSFGALLKLRILWIIGVHKHETTFGSMCQMC